MISAWIRRGASFVVDGVAVVTVALAGVTGKVIAATPKPAAWDTFADTWVATDDLGRRLPGHAEVGGPRSDRTVGLFYFLWHGAHIQGGPYDVTRILKEDPRAMSKPDSPLWGPLHAPHHWGESIFGYYLTDDEAVLRKHGQMLADVGVDVVIFDVTNQLTYPEWYRALLRVWTGMRAQGNRTPQVAFLAPFWDPAKVVRELWRDLYAPGLARELWFVWDGKPLILADPGLLDRREEHARQDTPVELEPGRTLGQSFVSDRPFAAVGGRFPTWRTAGAAVTLGLRRDGPGGERIAADRFHDVADNAWVMLTLPRPMPAGTYYLEASEPGGRIGWWSSREDAYGRGHAWADGRAVGGDRTLRLTWRDEETEAIRGFFTFRKPQPDYFQGPTQPDMWSWLEVHPQHVFRNARGEKEQMSVGVGQNAVGGRLGSMSEPGARGRSFHEGRTDLRPEAVRRGFNVAEQWERALSEDPRFVFVTGWNEWIAGRFAEFNGIKLPVMFVDQFDQEHSRDIEPMKGGHGDDYFYQFASYVRRYKGVRPLPEVRPRPIAIDGRFEDWAGVEPEFRDTIGDPMRRDHRGWSTNVVYRDASGRNDLVAAKVSFDDRSLSAWVRARAPLSVPEAGSDGLLLLLDLDGDAGTGWLGYDFVVGRSRRETKASVERSVAEGGEWGWQKVGEAETRMAGDAFEVAIPWGWLGREEAPAFVDFKWTDHLEPSGDATRFTLRGDAAPNDRFNYRAVLSGAGRGATQGP